MRLLDVIKLQD